MIGCMRRLARLFAAGSGRTFLLALDQGTAEGALPGLEAVPELLGRLDPEAIQGVVLNKGLARSFGAHLPVEVNLVVQVSAGTKHAVPGYARAVVCTAAEASRLGADAVAVQVNMGNDLEDRMLADFGAVSDEAHQLGLPVVASVYAKGGQIVNELDVSLVTHGIRLMAELGADVVCAPFPGRSEAFAKAVAACPAPVLAVGGPPVRDLEVFLAGLGQGLDMGLAGACVGRYVMEQADPAEAAAKVAALIHESEKQGKGSAKNRSKKR